jgi:hypothetical protein
MDLFKKPRTGINLAQVSIYSWGLDDYKGANRVEPIVKYRIDCSTWRNPECHKEVTTGRLNGLDPNILKWIAEDGRVGLVSRECYRLAKMLLDGQKETYITIGFVDHHGRWIAPAVAELVASDLEDHYAVGVEHYGLKPRQS